MRTCLILFLIQYSGYSFGQDTIQISDPPNGDYRIESYDQKAKKWTISEYFENTLFSIEELDSTKYFNVGTYKGFYSDGTLAFIREHQLNDGYSEVRGIKKIFYSNGKLKESGQYTHGIKNGKWNFYNENGEIARSVEYNVPRIDTVTNPKFVLNPKFSADTIEVYERSQFSDHFSIIDFGKNGKEIIFESGSPEQVNFYEQGKLIRSETKKRRIKKLLSH